MRLPDYAPSTSDRTSTREELFEVLELLGGFEGPRDTELAQTRELLALEGEASASPWEILDEGISSEERILLEIEPFNSLLCRKAERIN